MAPGARRCYHLLMRWAWTVPVLLLWTLLPETAHAKKSTSSVTTKSASAAKTPRPAKATGPAPRSVGSPTEGALVGGKRISTSKDLRLVGALAYGMPALVDMLERGAAQVAKKHPGSVLTVGDLSRKGGGEVDGHRSHESGRDADLGFYFTRGGKPFSPKRFATVDAAGNVVGLPSARFDDARNWVLVESMLTDPKARVLQIFVAHHLRARLLAQAARAGASPAVRNRAAEVLMQPRKALPHDNHFHVRIACPSADRACINFAKKQKSDDARAKKQNKKKPKRG